VDTPVYVTRVEQLYPQPVLVYTQRPDFISKIKIKSPNADKHFDQVYAKLVKPTREQQKFLAENHARPEQGHPGKMPGRMEVPPGQEKTRDNPPPHEKAGRPDLLPAQAKVHVAGKPRMHESSRMTAPPRVQFHEPKQPQRVNVARADPPRANRPMPQFAKPEPHFNRPAPQLNRPVPQMNRPGPPVQRGGGGKKKG
jgi:hypothetical protein